MAYVIYTDLLDDKSLSKLQKDLTKSIESGNSGYGGNRVSKTIQVYTVEETEEGRPAFIPFAYGAGLPAEFKARRASRKRLGAMATSFEGSLREEQRNCRDQALAILQTSKSVILSCYTGFGKTVTAINMASKIKLKTLISVPKTPLLGQWESEVRKFAKNASVEVMVPAKIKTLLRKKLGEEADPPDFCIVNSCNIHKIPGTWLAHYGLLVVDEAHLQMTEGSFTNLLKVTPRYIVGVTATPYREDGFDCLFNMFFGEEKVVYQLMRKHTVYKVRTGFIPDESKYLKYGPHYKSKLDWNAILEEQSKNESRNKLIVDIVCKFKDRVFLILVKRVEQGQLLLNTLSAKGEKVTSLLGKQQAFDKQARILIGTNSKIGTGFDHPRLDTLLVAADMVSYYIQFIGRVMRRKDTDPVIFDLVDSHRTLKKHFEQRSKVYTRHGGEIVKYKI